MESHFDGKGKLDERHYAMSRSVWLEVGAAIGEDKHPGLADPFHSN